MTLEEWQKLSIWKRRDRTFARSPKISPKEVARIIKKSKIPINAYLVKNVLRGDDQLYRNAIFNTPVPGGPSIGESIIFDSPEEYAKLDKDPYAEKNGAIFYTPQNATKAIIAHELGHAKSFQDGTSPNYKLGKIAPALKKASKITASLAGLGVLSSPLLPKNKWSDTSYKGSLGLGALSLLLYGGSKLADKYTKSLADKEEQRATDYAKEFLKEIEPDKKLYADAMEDLYQGLESYGIQTKREPRIPYV